METAIWQDYQEDDVMVIGISNTQNVNEFVDENNLTFPILFDPGSNGGVDGGDTYDLYYLPNDGSPYPRDFIIGPDGIVEYANNEIDFTWMLYILDELLGYNDQIPGDVNYDGTLNILLTLLFMLLAARSRHWRFWLILSGATWVSALQTTYLGSYIPAVIFWYLFLNQKHLRHPIIPSALYIFAGAVTAFLIYCITSYLLGGPFLFFMSTIRPMLEQATIFTFHRGYWQPFSYLLQHSKGIVLPILGGSISVFILIALLIKRPKRQISATVVLTQSMLLI